MTGQRRTMTGGEAARYLGIASSSVRHAIADGRLKARKVGRDWYITIAEVERYKAERRDSGRPYKRPPSSDADAPSAAGASSPDPGADPLPAR